MIVLLTLIVISPYLVRNILLVDSITITKSIGWNLWKGNHPKATVEGNLYLKGYGDPWLIPERMWYLANRLKALGIKKITGDIVIDGNSKA